MHIDKFTIAVLCITNGYAFYRAFDSFWGWYYKRKEAALIIRQKAQWYDEDREKEQSNENEHQ